MKIVDKVKVKDKITNFNLADVVEMATEFVIRKDDNGVIHYTPYYREYGILVGIAKYLIEGVEYDKSDDILDEIDNSEEIRNAVEKVTENQDYMDFINENLFNIVSFRKQQYLNDFSELKERLLKSVEIEQKLNELNLKLAEHQNTLLKQQIETNKRNEKVMEYVTPEEIAELSKKLLSGDYDIQKITDMVTEKYINSELHAVKEKELIDFQASKIKELESTKKSHAKKTKVKKDE